MFICWWLLVAFENVVAISDRPILAQVVLRHGEKNYEHDPYFPTDPQSSRVPVRGEPGELTNVRMRHVYRLFVRGMRGVRQLYDVGRNLKALYGHLLTDYEPSMLRVLAGEINRTVDSANAALAGWAPMRPTSTSSSGGVDDVSPLRVAPVHTDANIDLVRPGIRKLLQCPEYRRRALLSAAYRKMQVKYESLMAYLAQKTGLRIDDIIHLKSVISSLEYRRSLFLPLPEWDDGKTITQDRFAQVKVDYFAVIFDQLQATRILAHWTFMQIVAELRNRVYNNTNHRFVMYSAHQENIAVLGYLLNISGVKKRNPLFGAYLAIEMYNRTNRFEVKLTYSAGVNEPASYVSVPECPAPCWLETFTRLADSDAHNGDYCGIAVENTVTEHSIMWFLFFGVTLLLLVWLAVALSFVYVYRERLNRLVKGEKPRLVHKGYK